MNEKTLLFELKNLRSILRSLQNQNTSLNNIINSDIVNTDETITNKINSFYNWLEKTVPTKTANDDLTLKYNDALIHPLCLAYYSGNIYCLWHDSDNEYLGTINILNGNVTQIVQSKINNTTPISIIKNNKYTLVSSENKNYNILQFSSDFSDMYQKAVYVDSCLLENDILTIGNDNANNFVATLYSNVMRYEWKNRILTIKTIDVHNPWCEIKLINDYEYQFITNNVTYKLSIDGLKDSEEENKYKYKIAIESSNQTVMPDILNIDKFGLNISVVINNHNVAQLSFTTEIKNTLIRYDSMEAVVRRIIYYFSFIDYDSDDSSINPFEGFGFTRFVTNYISDWKSCVGCKAPSNLLKYVSCSDELPKTNGITNLFIAIGNNDSNKLTICKFENNEWTNNIDINNTIEKGEWFDVAFQIQTNTKNKTDDEKSNSWVLDVPSHNCNINLVDGQYTLTFDTQTFNITNINYDTNNYEISFMDLNGNNYNYLIKTYINENSHIDINRVFIAIGTSLDGELISARSDDYGVTWSKVNIEKYDFSYVDISKRVIDRSKGTYNKIIPITVESNILDNSSQYSFMCIGYDSVGYLLINTFNYLSNTWEIRYDINNYFDVEICNKVLSWSDDKEYVKMYLDLQGTSEEPVTNTIDDNNNLIVKWKEDTYTFYKPVIDENVLSWFNFSHYEENEFSIYQTMFTCTNKNVKIAINNDSDVFNITDNIITGVMYINVVKDNKSIRIGYVSFEIAAENENHIIYPYINDENSFTINIGKLNDNSIAPKLRYADNICMNDETKEVVITSSTDDKYNCSVLRMAQNLIVFTENVVGTKY